MPYRITLAQNLSANQPAALQVRYTYTNGAPASTWGVTPVGQDTNTAVVVVNAPVNLVTVQNVATRTLLVHYPSSPNPQEIAISSVQPSQPTGTLVDAGATGYSVQITMSQATVDGLTASGFNLFGFKAVQAAAGGGAPLVWFQTKEFGLKTTVSWEEQYQAYTSLSAIIANGQITEANSYDIGLGQTLNVTSTSGTGTVDVTHGTAGAISISNGIKSQFTCGISQTQADGTVAAMCAFPLYGLNLDLIAPIEKVLLMFSTSPVNTGTVIEQAYSPGILIDLTGENSRDVSYDINEGWSWGGSSWAAPVNAGDSLVPLLIENSASLAKRHLASLQPS